MYDIANISNITLSPCTEGYPVEGVVYVGEDVEEVGGVELACKRNFHFCK